MAVGSVGGGISIHPPALKWPVAAKVISNDPSMRINSSGTQISIRGTASNRGIVASFARFEVGGKKISIPLSRGTTPADVLATLKKKLPKQFSVMGTPSSFQIMHN